MERLDDLLDILEYKEGALNHTEKQIAKKGDDAPYALIHEKNSLQNEINSLRSRIKQLSGETLDETISNLPSRQNFIGRKKDKEACLAALSQDQQGWGAIIDGAGGMGKTALAIECAHLAKKSGMFDSYLFESAKTTYLTSDGIRTETLRLSSLDSFIRSYSQFLNLTDIADQPNPSERIRLFISKLSGRRILFIFDNMETLPIEERNKVGEFLERLPNGNKAILTSRIRTGEAAKTIRLTKLPDQEVEDLINNAGELSSPSFIKEWRKAEKSVRLNFILATGGNPLIIRYAIGRIDIEEMRLEKMVNLLQKSPPSEVFSFLFADAIQSLSNLETEVLFALTYSDSTDITVLDKLIKAPKSEIQNCLAKLTTMSLINSSSGETEKFSLNEVFKNYAVFIAQRSTRNEHNDLNLNINVSLLASVSDKVLAYWIDFVEKNGSVDRTGINENWDNIAKTCQSLYELSGLPSKIINHEMASKLVSIALILCESDGALMSLGLWSECIKIGEWGYDAASQLKDDLSSFILAGYVAQIYFNFQEKDKVKEWLEKSKISGQAAKNKGHLPQKLQNSHLLVIESRDRIPLLHKELETIKDNNDSPNKVNLVKVLNSLGEAYQEIGDFILAHKYLRESLDLVGDIEFNSSFWRTQILINLGNNYLRKKKASFTESWLSWTKLNTFTNWLWEGDPPVWFALFVSFPVTFIVAIPVVVSMSVEWVLNQAGKALTGFDPSKPDFNSAQACFEQALEIAKSNHLAILEAKAQLGLAYVSEGTGQVAQALAKAKSVKNILINRIPAQSKMKELEDLMSRLEK